MRKKLISAVIGLAMLSTYAVIPMTAQAEAKVPQYQKNVRQMEEIGRGLIAAYRVEDGRNVLANEAGVYLSWRLLGDEPLETQEFDIYRNDIYIATTSGAKGTNYIDSYGTKTDTYKVVKKNASEAEVAKAQAVTPQDNHVAASSSYTNLKQSFTYTDIEIERPADSEGGHYYTVDKNTEGGANDASVGDLDGDGEYEIVLKWDPTNSKDAAAGGVTGHTYLDGYEINGDQSGEHKYMWRIDLGPHVRSGAHENPFLVYDFDGDGFAEIASLSGPGAIDGTGHYVTEVGDTEEIRNADNTKLSLNRGKNIGPEYYTLFDGKTGKALWTTNAIPIGSTDGKNWGKNLLNESQRYLAAVAYLDGVHPSIVMCRGYYYRAALRAYTWDGSEMTMQWEYDCGQSGIQDDSLYRQGNHNLSVGDIDGDGRDEIVYGSAALDDDGRTVLGNTKLGHGDAMHMNDFNNDGKQEVMSVKEHEMKTCAENFRDALTGKNLHTRILTTSSDNGRGVMDNIDDAYALAQYKAGNSAAMALSWSSGFDYIHDMTGNDLKTDDGSSKAKPAAAGNGSFDNFLVYWDGDLGRELLDANIIQKYDAENGWTTRFWGENDGYTLTGGTTNNYTKRNASLVADLWGDWREEIIMPVGKGKDETPKLRIFTSTLPTEYRLTTLMHDCQYRLAIAWQNVAYNQPPHTSYYVGSVALATDEGGNTLNYLAPAVPYTKVTYDAPAQVAVEGIEIANKEITVEKGKSASIGASVVPDDATKKGVTYTSSDESVATVSNGFVTGVSVGTATITATTKDGGFTDTCTVTVFENPVTSVALSEKSVELGIGNTANLTATVMPQDASDKSVTWRSEDTSVANVDNKGVITGVGLGKTTVTATAGNKTAKCIVKVKPMSIVDATGDDVFEASGADGDKAKFTGTSNSAALTLNEATSFVEFHKDFEAIDKNTATLSFHFTTGGAKTTDYIWKLGHEYNTELKFLDTNGKQIFDIIEQHLTSGNTTYYSVGDYSDGGGGWQKASDWKKISDGDDNPWNRSQIRWDITVTFDYAADTGTINLAGCNNAWVRSATYETTFPLNGASFKTLKYETNTITDWVSGNPKLEQLSYTSTEQVSGNTDVLYEKGTDNIAWAETDIADWTQTGTDTAALAFDSENGRILYNPTKPAAEYNAKKTFDVTDGAVVSYDVDWYFGNSLGRDGHYDYIQLGDNLRLGWANGYKIMLSTDGGATYGADAVFTGENTTYTKNVKAQFNTADKTVTLSLDGKQIYSGAYSADGANSVTFGFTRNGGTSDWNYPNGIDRIRVAQFIEGEEDPDFSAVKITGTEGNKVNIAYDLLDYNGSIQFIGALYDVNGNLVEVKANEVLELDDSVQHIRKGTDSITFTNDIASGKVKVFMWDSIKNMNPIGEADK